MVTNLREGAKLGGYRIRGLLFRSVAFDAYSALDRRGIAVCLLCAEAREARPNDDEFRSGIEALRTLKGEGLPQVLSGGRDEAYSWMVTEAIGATEPYWNPGRERLHWIRVLWVAKNVARGLFYPAQHAGLNHGSLGPECIRKYKSGQVCVVGAGALALFGIDSGAILASPRYLAPEAVNEPTQALHEQADLYALGMWMYAALMGKEPFHGAATDALLSLAKHGSPVIECSAPIPPAIWELCSTLTRKDRVDRFPPWAALTRFVPMLLKQGYDDEKELDRDPHLDEALALVLDDEAQNLSPEEAKRILALARAEAHEESDSEDEEPEPEADSLNPAQPASVEVPIEPPPAPEEETEPLDDPTDHPTAPLGFIPQITGVANDVYPSFAERYRRALRIAGVVLVAACFALSQWAPRLGGVAPLRADQALHGLPLPVIEPPPPEPQGIPGESERRPRPQIAAVPTARGKNTQWTRTCNGYFGCKKPISWEDRGKQ